MALKNLTNKQLDTFDSVLREYPNLSCLELRDLIRDEQTRRSTPSLNEAEIVSKFLLKYIKLEFNDGIGSYEIWKIARVDDLGNKTFVLYPDKSVASISNIDGEYSISTYLENVTIETDEDLEAFTVINKEEYDSEFEKAIEYYKSLKKD